MAALPQALPRHHSKHNQQALLARHHETLLLQHGLAQLPHLWKLVQALGCHSHLQWALMHWKGRACALRHRRLCDIFRRCRLKRTSSCTQIDDWHHRRLALSSQSELGLQERYTFWHNLLLQNALLNLLKLIGTCAHTTQPKTLSRIRKRQLTSREHNLHISPACFVIHWRRAVPLKLCNSPTSPQARTISAWKCFRTMPRPASREDCGTVTNKCKKPHSPSAPKLTRAC